MRALSVTAAIVLGSGLFLLSACGASDDDQGAGGVTAGEARALNDAAVMLDARQENAAAALNGAAASN